MERERFARNLAVMAGGKGEGEGGKGGSTSRERWGAIRRFVGGGLGGEGGAGGSAGGG